MKTSQKTQIMRCVYLFALCGRVCVRACACVCEPVHFNRLKCGIQNLHPNTGNVVHGGLDYMLCCNC